MTKGIALAATKEMQFRNPQGTLPSRVPLHCIVNCVWSEATERPHSFIPFIVDPDSDKLNGMSTKHFQKSTPHTLQ